MTKFIVEDVDIVDAAAGGKTPADNFRDIGESNEYEIVKTNRACTCIFNICHGV